MRQERFDLSPPLAGTSDEPGIIQNALGGAYAGRLPEKLLDRR
jgi:hypothetical protein